MGAKKRNGIGHARRGRKGVTLGVCNYLLEWLIFANCVGLSMNPFKVMCNMLEETEFKIVQRVWLFIGRYCLPKWEMQCVVAFWIILVPK